MNAETPPEGFARTWARLLALADLLASDEARGLSSAEVEEMLQSERGPLLQQFLQDALERRARQQGGAGDGTVPPREGEPAHHG